MAAEKRPRKKKRLPQVMGNCSANVSHGWATHGADVAFVEGKFGGKRVSGVPGSRNQSCTVQKGCELTPMELALVDRMQSFWGSFIRSGRPVGGEEPLTGMRAGACSSSASPAPSVPLLLVRQLVAGESAGDAGADVRRRLAGDGIWELLQPPLGWPPARPPPRGDALDRSS